MSRRADWRLLDYTGRIRAEVRGVEVRQVAPAFQSIIQATACSGAAVPHPQIAVRRKGERAWVKLGEDERRRFWGHAGPAAYRREVIAGVAAAIRERGEYACGGFEDDAAEFVEGLS